MFDRAGAGGQRPNPKIGVLVERRYLRQDMPGAVIRELQTRGLSSDVICPQNGWFDPTTGVLHGTDGGRVDLNDYDVLLARVRTPLGLAMLRYTDVAGIPAVNSHASTQRVRNKAKMAIALGRAGIRCAPTVLTDDTGVLAGVDPSWFPLILKATYGDNSQGLRLVRSPQELFDVRWSDGLVLAQRYLANDGFDLKLYVCGDRVAAVRKPSPFNGDVHARPQPTAADAASVDLARRCGEVFGLEIYGVDTIETADGPVVIEVNEFPNFSAVAGAAADIADYVLARIEPRSARHARRISPAARRR